MFAIIGSPGSETHRFNHFPAARGEVASVRREAETWLEEEYGSHAHGINPRHVLSDKTAKTVKWRDGNHVYLVAAVRWVGAKVKRIILIGCGKAKLEHAAPARDLYTGSLFRAARGFAEASGERWFIISALHDLLEPGEVIAPYDETMRIWAPPHQAWLWGNRVITEIFQVVPVFWRGLLDGNDLRLEIHAGKAYVEPMREAVHRFQGRHETMYGLGKIRIDEPLQGLQIGERLAWYKKRRQLNGVVANK